MDDLSVGNLEMLAAQEPWSMGTMFLIREKVFQGKSRYVTALTVSDVAEGGSVKPSLTMSNDAVQRLFNSLWQLGFRPKDGTGNSGHVESLKYHLEDMRKLVFNDSKDGSPNG